MRKLLRWLGLGLTLLLVAAALAVVPTVWSTPWSVDHLYTRGIVRPLLKSPMLLTQLGMLRQIGLTFYEDDIDDMSLGFEEQVHREMHEELAVLRSFERPTEPEAALSYDTMAFFLEYWFEPRWVRHEYNLDPIDGAHVRLPSFITGVHPMELPRDAHSYLARVRQFPRALTQEAEAARERAQGGILPPSFILERIERDARAFAATPLEENPIVTAFEEGALNIEGLSQTEREQLLAELRQVVAQECSPAWGAFADAIAALNPAAKGSPSPGPTDRAGVWKHPEGGAYYAWRLRQQTTTDMSAEEIHQKGIELVAALAADVNRILDEHGVEAETPGDGMRQLARDPRYLAPNDEAGRQRVLAGYQEMIDEASARMSELFGLKPSAPVAVEPVPAFKEASAPFGRYEPPPMGSNRPGVFYVNLRSIDESPTWMMRTIAYHEAVPGHHFQIMIAREREDLPMFRRLIPFMAYVEGWALYAERIMDEHGFHRDPLDRLGYLQMQLFRAARMVVDTGLHHKRWTRQQAVDYLLANSGLPVEEIETEVDRYAVWPGQATAYMVGQLKFLELRDLAKQRLGERFDLRAFHDQVLSTGALPLTLLEREVVRWIAEQEE